MDLNIKHFDRDNKYKDDILDIMVEYNEELSSFDMSFPEMAMEFFDDSVDSVEEGAEVYYDELCDEVVVCFVNEKIVGFRFVEFDKEDEYFRENIDNYKIGLNLTFALVRENYRNNGIWKKMFDYVKENIVSDYNVDRLYIATSSENDAMRYLVNEVGFNLATRIKNERGDGVDSLLYYYDIK